MIRPSRELDEVLNELRLEHRSTAAPAHLGARLQERIRWRGRRRFMMRTAIAAAILLAALMWKPGQPVHDPGEAEFVPIPGSEGLPVPMGTGVLRVGLPRAALLQFGLKVAPSRAAEMVDADFLVGDDGLARAVRFVGEGSK